MKGIPGTGTSRTVSDVSEVLGMEGGVGVWGVASHVEP